MLIKTDNPPPWLERFEAKIEPEPMSGCWLWTGARSNGYGHFNKGKDVIVWAHRVAWELTHGMIPEGLTIDHLCRVRVCVNPAHLRIVTNRENILAGNGFSAVNARKRVCAHGHAYDQENTMWVHRSTGEVERACWRCFRERRARVAAC